ncbi:MAG TPA: type II secretion system F family protein [Gemmataceae bacterium]|nr:type II secretion system F family protein [Gemmataceae bacterium]
MPEFAYEAMAVTGQRSQGTLTAQSEREAMAMLDARGLFPVRIQVARSSSGSVFQFGKGKKVRPKYMAPFYSQLSDLLRSGVPLLRSLDILERQSIKPALAEVLREVRAKVADGTGLAEAMGQHPGVFSELAVSMVKAGQEGGFLEDVLQRIADFTEHQEDLKSKVVGALAYPVFLASAGSIVLVILLVFFVPKFEQLFQKMEEKGELPLLTQAVMGASRLLASPGGLLVAAGIVLGVIAFVWWKRTPAGRLRLDGWRLRMPGAGRIYLQYALSRFTRILGTLLHNGIPILQALRIAKDSTGNKVLAEAIEKSAENIKGGNSLAAPLAACKYFPRDVVEMISVGEESNSLEKVLVDVSESLEKRTTRQLDLFVRLLEPLMLLVMAVIILIVVAALLMPIFNMGTVVDK